MTPELLLERIYKKFKPGEKFTLGKLSRKVFTRFNWIEDSYYTYKIKVLVKNNKLICVEKGFGENDIYMLPEAGQ